MPEVFNSPTRYATDESVEVYDNGSIEWTDSESLDDLERDSSHAASTGNDSPQGGFDPTCGVEQLGYWQGSPSSAKNKEGNSDTTEEEDIMDKIESAAKPNSKQYDTTLEQGSPAEVNQDNAGTSRTSEKADYVESDDLEAGKLADDNGKIISVKSDDENLEKKGLYSEAVRWIFSNKDQFLSAITVAFGQVPEVVSYSLIAGLDPLLALQGTWVMGIATAVVGGRPGMICGASGAVAVALINLVQESGVEYIFYAVMFAGLVQMLFGILRLGVLLRFVPYPIMVGFVNTMALIITFAQLKYFKEPGAMAGGGRTFEVGSHNNYYQVLLGETQWIELTTLTVMLIEASASFFICVVLPRITKLVPSPFVAISVVTIIEWALVRPIRYPSLLVRDYSSVTPYILKPPFMDEAYNLPPLNWDTFKTIWPTGIAVFAVSLVETLLTYDIVGKATSSPGSPDLVVLGQGLGNFLAALLGGMGGGAMLGQTVVNCKSRGTTRLSSAVAGITLLILMLGAYPVVEVVPLAAFVGVMFYAAYNLCDWTAFLTILASLFPQKFRDFLYLDHKVNRSDTFIMLVVMVLTFFLDSAIAVITGSTIAAYAYCWDWSKRIEVDREYTEGEDLVTYNIRGPLFFGTSDALTDMITKETIENDPKEVILFMQDAEVFDWSGLIALKRMHDLIVSCNRAVALSSISASTKKLMEKSSVMWESVVFLELHPVGGGPSVEQSGDENEGRKPTNSLDHAEHEELEETTPPSKNAKH